MTDATDGAADRADSPGQRLADELQTELAAIEAQIRGHRFLAALERGAVPRERLIALAAAQHMIIASDRRSFALLAARFPEPPAGDLFLVLAEGEGQALTLLRDFRAAVGLDDAALADHEPDPGAHGYPAVLAWLALNGSRADVSLAMLVNLAAWGAGCARVRRALADRYGLDDASLAFFGFFADPAPAVERRLRATLDAGLAAGECPVQARRAARLLQAAELRFWDTLAEGVA